MKLFLFDLDGTLVTTAGAGMRALDRAFQALFSLADAINGISPSGKTDPAIFREIFQKKLNRDMNPSDFSAVSQRYLSYLDEELRDASRTRALSGVSDFLEFLSGQDGIMLGLGTGNLEPGARLKLSPVGLNRFFSFGGFGSDAEDRALVLKSGHERANKLNGTDISKRDVYILGDTILDIRAARRAGFRSVGIASGRAGVDELAEAGPDAVWKDMTEGFNFFKTVNA